MTFKLTAGDLDLLDYALDICWGDHGSDSSHSRKVKRQIKRVREKLNNPIYAPQRSSTWDFPVKKS